MRKKQPAPPPEFPKPREEFAGELAPGLYPGPITCAHPGRFGYRDVSRPEPPDADDTGLK